MLLMGPPSRVTVKGDVIVSTSLPSAWIVGVSSSVPTLPAAARKFTVPAGTGVTAVNDRGRLAGGTVGVASLPLVVNDHAVGASAFGVGVAVSVIPDVSWTVYVVFSSSGLVGVNVHAMPPGVNVPGTADDPLSTWNVVPLTPATGSLNVTLMLSVVGTATSPGAGSRTVIDGGVVSACVAVPVVNDQDVGASASPTVSVIPAVRFTV